MQFTLNVFVLIFFRKSRTKQFIGNPSPLSRITRFLHEH